MIDDDRKYMVKAPDGSHYGPAVQSVLVEWAREGRITADCEVSSTLLRRWKKPADIPFLAGAVAAREAELKAAEPVSAAARMKERMAGAAPAPAAGQALHRSRVFEFTPASCGLRVLAAALDTAVMVLALLAVSGGAALARQAGFGAAALFAVGAAVFHVVALAYFTFSVAFYSQTPGQRFWGIMVLRTEGGPVYAGRAFVLALCTVWLGLLTPLTLFIFGGRTLQESLSGTRVIRTRIIGNE